MEEKTLPKGPPKTGPSNTSSKRGPSKRPFTCQGMATEISSMMPTTVSTDALSSGVPSPYVTAYRGEGGEGDRGVKEET